MAVWRILYYSRTLSVVLIINNFLYMKKYFRHGDINFAPFNGKIKGKKIKHNGIFIFGLGETTGHKHVISVPTINDMEVFETSFGRIFRLKTSGTLSHEEHDTINIPAGDYKQIQEREKDWFSLSVRRVID